MKMAFAVMHKDQIFTLREYPKHVDNPSKWRFWVLREGKPVGAAKTKAEAELKIRSGWYDDGPALAREKASRMLSTLREIVAHADAQNLTDVCFDRARWLLQEIEGT